MQGGGGILNVGNNSNTVSIFIVDGLLVLYITLSFKPDSVLFFILQSIFMKAVIYRKHPWVDN